MGWYGHPGSLRPSAIRVIVGVSSVLQLLVSVLQVWVVVAGEVYVGDKLVGSLRCRLLLRASGSSPRFSAGTMYLAVS